MQKSKVLCVGCSVYACRYSVCAWYGLKSIYRETIRKSVEDPAFRVVGYASLRGSQKM